MLTGLKLYLSKDSWDKMEPGRSNPNTGDRTLCCSRPESQSDHKVSVYVLGWVLLWGQRHQIGPSREVLAGSPERTSPENFS